MVEKKRRDLERKSTGKVLVEDDFIETKTKSEKRPRHSHSKSFSKK